MSEYLFDLPTMQRNQKQEMKHDFEIERGSRVTQTETMIHPCKGVGPKNL